MNIPQKKIIQLANEFCLSGNVVSVDIIGNGNINQTYDVVIQNGENTERYIFQKLNTYVFRQPRQIMENIDHITAHIGAKLQAADESRDRVMHFVKRANGENFFEDEDGFWRICEFVPDTVAYNASDDPKILCAAGRAFGQFQMMLADFDAAMLYETIPDFHNTKKRIATLMQHVKEDPCGRVSKVAPELEAIGHFRFDAEQLCDMLEKGLLPLRVTHNDTKINNVLFDAVSGEEKTVIDLDTVMPGLVAYDFGDAIRFAGNRAAEDEKDLSLVGLDMERFEAFARGFIPAVADTLTENERNTLPLGVFVMTVELVVRFLDDYICGDQYFKVLYPEHNLVRTRCQLRLAKDVWAHMDEMNRIISDIAAQK